MRDPKKTGKKGEEFAIHRLIKSGFFIVEQNFFSRYGEIDIIATKEDVIAFIEVKTRSSVAFGLPCQAVGMSKQKKMIKTAAMYLLEKEVDLQPRFDVIEVVVAKTVEFKITQFRHIESAFEINELNRF